MRLKACEGGCIFKQTLADATLWPYSIPELEGLLERVFLGGDYCCQASKLFSGC